MSTERLLAEALGGRRDEVLLALDRADAEDSLWDYFRLMWKVLEPTRALAESRALEMMCEVMQAVGEGHIKKIILSVPPGTSKSTLVDVIFPTWVWGPHGKPDKRFAAWSYSSELTIRNNDSKRRIVSSELFKQLWGADFKLVTDQSKLVKNDRTGFWYASSIEGGGTGHRADFRLIDDPLRAKDADSPTKRYNANLFMAETLPTRGTDADSAVVMIAQRLHQDDPTGRVLAEELGYEHMCLPMEFEADHPHLWHGFDFPGASEHMREGDWRKEDGELLCPERFSREEVEDQKKDLRSVGGDYAVAGQFQQRPVARGGGLFPEKYVQIMKSRPTEDQVVSRVRGWDLAASDNNRAAYTVGVLLARLNDGRILVEHVKRLRAGPAEVKEAILAAAKRDGSAVRQDLPQDPGQAGKGQKADLAALLDGYNVRFSRESGSKELRAVPFAAQWEAGNVWILDAEWNAEYIRELVVFPQGKFLDQVDASSRAHAALAGVAKPKVATYGPIVIGPGG